MPQMAPIMWDTLLIISFLILMVMAAKIYFYFSVAPSENFETSPSAKNNSQKTVNWTW